MQLTLPERLLRRQIGDRSPYASVPGLYGDKSWVDDLDIVNELGGHSGCVNALCWSRSGRLLASGSDDFHVNIHSYLPDGSATPFNLATSISTGHTANIFSVKFMPHSNDRTLVSCAGDGDVRVFDIEYSSRSSIPSDTAQSGRRLGLNTVYNGVRYLGEADTNARVYRSHADRVKRIVTESSPHLFLTCSEDGEVRQWDLRQPSSAYPSPAGGRGFLSVRGMHASEDSNVPPPLISYARYHLDLNTISCSATQPHYIALGGAHLHCFLHDRRMLGRDVPRERGTPASPSSDGREEQMDQATKCVRRFAPNGATKMKSTDNGHITACKISDHNPNEMVVSWSGDWIYSFDLIRSPGADSPEDGPSGTLRRGTGDGRTRESRVRKRKREKTSSDSSGEARRAGSKPRQGGAETDPDGDLTLRVRYENGQTEDIPIEEESTATTSSGANPAAEARATLRSDSPKKAYDIARATLQIRKELFGLESRKWTPETASSSPATMPQADTTPFTFALGYAATYLPIIDEMIRSWRYPLNPTEDEVSAQQYMRRNREAVFRLVQAAGTTARVLGGKLRTAGRGESPMLEYFKRITFAPNEMSPLDPSDQFAYDFLRAILAWLDGGREGLLDAFKRSSTDRLDHPRCPIPQDADLDALDDILIPYLLRLAGDRTIFHINPSRFERDEPETVFNSEKAAVIAFSHAIRIPLGDLSRAVTAGSSGGAPGPAVTGVHDRQTAITFWAFKVARGVLMNAAEDVNTAFIMHAFGGLEEMSEEEARFLEDGDAGENRDAGTVEARERTSQTEPESTGAEMEDNEHEGEGSSRPSTYRPALVEDYSEDEMIVIEHAHDETAEHGEASEAEDEEDDDEGDSDMEGAENEAEEGQFIFSSGLHRNRMREQVEAHVPCSSHTRVYRGHCNVETVKDVNFVGLQDEYVVSGSDAGHFFIWDKKTSEIVNILEGDEAVVNVIQGHPYEPMLAVSGMDHTIKIFSPDRRAQWEARNGINLAQGSSKDKRAPHAARYWLHHRRRRRQATGGDDEEENEQKDAQDGGGNGDDGAAATTTPATEGGHPNGDDHDDDEEDIAKLPARNGGLASRRRMHDAYRITSQNDQRRQGGMHDARLTRGMLAQIAARLRARQISEGGGGTGAGNNGGGDGPHVTAEVEGIILDENCEVM